MRSVGVSRLISGHKIATFERPHHSHSLLDSQVLAEQFSSTFLFSTPARLELQTFRTLCLGICGKSFQDLQSVAWC